MIGKNLNAKAMTFAVRTIFVALLLAIFIPPVASRAAKLTASKAAAMFDRANGLFHQANQMTSKNPEKAKALYLQAAMAYKDITAPGGLENGSLYYDIANSYFRGGNIGRAILNYLRAEEYIPNDKNLHDNLAYARATRPDRISEKTETRVFKTLFFWHYDLSVTQRVIGFEICFALIWLLAALRRFFRKAVPAAAVYSAIFLSILFGASLAATAYTQKTIRPGVIIDASVTARKGNGESYTKCFTHPLHAGTEFVLIEKRGNWFNIRLADARTCWIPDESAKMVR